MDDMNKRYSKLKGPSVSLNTDISAFIRIPTEDDYKKGYITRFFTQKVNDKGAPIYEISNTMYNGLTSNVLYNVTSLRWRLSGPVLPTTSSKGDVVDMGVRESNKKSIELASENITNLKLYLPNTLQFYKP